MQLSQPDRHQRRYERGSDDCACAGRPIKTAYATIKGFDVMRMFKKGQFARWIDAIGGRTEARFIHRL
jgi:hypothetical protein